MIIKFDTLGKILEGDNSGWFVKIINDQNKTGGFFIYEFKDIDGKEGYDTWLENEVDVKGYIYESEWKIEWLDDSSKKIQYPNNPDISSDL